MHWGHVVVSYLRSRRNNERGESNFLMPAELLATGREADCGKGQLVRHFSFMDDGVASAHSMSLQQKIYGSAAATVTEPPRSWEVGVLGRGSPCGVGVHCATLRAIGCSIRVRTDSRESELPISMELLRLKLGSWLMHGSRWICTAQHSRDRFLQQWDFWPCDRAGVASTTWSQDLCGFCRVLTAASLSKFSKVF
jgi:hypothetical protein